MNKPLTLKEKLALKRAAGSDHMIQLMQRMQSINTQQSAIVRSLSDIRVAAAHKNYNPYSRLAIFAANAPDDPTTAAALMVAAFGYETAAQRCVSLAEAHEVDAHAWEMAQEIIEQMAEVAKAQEKQHVNVEMPVASATEDDELAPEAAPDNSHTEERPAGAGESFSLNITLNEQQKAAAEMAAAGKSFCLIGPAGSGKTTATRTVAKNLYETGRFADTTFKQPGKSPYSAPSIAFCAFTRRAAGNLRKAIHKDPTLAQVLAGNIMTIHALLEYQPEYYTDHEGNERFRFAPMRTAKNPLTITHLVIEEASMVDAYELWMRLFEALPSDVQIIFIGDINQLPPVFGPSILNYALIQLPIVELVETYRNQGSVLDNAHHILRGEMIETTDECKIYEMGKDVQHGQNTVGNKLLPAAFKKLFETIQEDGTRAYDPEYDMILSGYNKQEMGTINMNANIAQFVGDARGAIVHEVIAGFNKLYLAEGDKVMVNKRDGIITEIRSNPSYYGKQPQLPGNNLSRKGIRIMDRISNIDLDDESTLEEAFLDYDNFSLDNLEKENAERKQQASHVVKIKYDDDGFEEEISSAGDFADQVFTLGYVLTGHKAQGSEWRKVFILLHKDHATMLFREWLYTAYTRARISCIIFGKKYLVEQAISRPRIKGNTMKDKLAYFNSGITNASDIFATPALAIAAADKKEGVE